MFSEAPPGRSERLPEALVACRARFPAALEADRASVLPAAAERQGLACAEKLDMPFSFVPNGDRVPLRAPEAVRPDASGAR